MGPLTTSDAQGFKPRTTVNWGRFDFTRLVAGFASVCLTALTSCSASSPTYQAQPIKPQTAVQAHATRAQPDPLVRSAQTTLIQLGYLRGVADGYCGPKTRAAIADFEHAHASPADESCSASRLQMMNSPAAVAAKAPQAVPGPVPNLVAVTSSGGRQAPTPIAPIQLE